MLPTIIGVGILAIIVGAILAVMIIDKKKGKSSCGSNCAHCIMADKCHPQKNNNKK
ncbi:MAG: FeoB-associated Cys-rich membrane protein [Clostridia bacterium]|nr:FeoB-associated Cys-rich membrane protein [Clostridia bacterium]MBQ7788608.1 FeoB-associated Cys-rich membrane protein [Clostridia bacterium]